MKKQASTDNALGALRYGFRQALKSPTILSLMAAPFATAGIRKLESKRRERESALGKATAYKQMVELHPHFKSRDQAEIGRIYNSLHNASPNMARDPMVAGAWVDNVVENRVPGMNSHQALLNAVRELNGMQKNISDMERNRGGASPVSEQVGTFIEKLGPAYDKGIHDNIDRAFKKNKGQFDQQKNDLTLREREAALNNKEMLFQATQTFSAMADKADKRQRELEQYEHNLKKLHDEIHGKKKTSSARSSLGDMLRTLKV
jgi:hypothetical protein